MKGLTVAQPGAPYVLTSDLEKPTPGKEQVLVKSMFTAINLVETFMSATGLLVTSWPVVLGCDASGTVVEVGEGVTKFKKGDDVFGCTRLGVPGYSTFQEYFLMDEHITFLKPDTIQMEEAATVGVGVDTACLGLIAGLGLKFPGKGEHPSFDEWIIIQGGSGTIGQYAVQVAKLCGYKVLATCSPSKDFFVKSLGASATMNYKDDISSQISQIISITSGKFSRIFDCTAASAPAAFQILTEASKAEKKCFATVDDWSPMEGPSSVEVYRIHLGLIGRSDAEADVVTNAIASFVPKVEALLDSKELKPMQYEVVGTGPESVTGAISKAADGSMGVKKTIVQLGDKW